MFKVAIIGGKETNDYERFRTKCINLLRNKAKEGIFILSTGDDYVDKFASRYRIDVENFYADFTKFGKMALKKRNDNLFAKCDAVIAFSPEKKDIQTIVNFAKEHNIPTREIKSIDVI